MRRFIAVALALSLLTSTVAGCSQPIDTGSSVPAQSQPIVALLALVGLGIGLTAWHHHNEEHHGGGSTPTIFGAQFSVAPFIAGFKPVDLAADQLNGTLGALELATAGGAAKFTEVFDNGTGLSAFATYPLPTGYAPGAVTMDTNGVTWFVDAAGHVQGCDPMTSTTTTCVSAGTFIDGLGAGSRSIAADVDLIVVVTDAGSGKVNWWAQQGTTATGHGTYASPTSTSPIYANDTVKLVSTSPSVFTVYHQDGSSEAISFSVSGSALTINTQANFVLAPPSLAGPSSQESETSGKIAVFGFTGVPSGSYRLSKYETSTVTGLGQATATSQLIAFNGQVGNPGGGLFAPPLIAPTFDLAQTSVWAIDSQGRIVNFAPF